MSDALDGPVDKTAAKVEAALPLVAEAVGPQKRKRKAIPWSEAIPENLNLDDSLEVAAKLGPRAVAVALTQMLTAPGVKPVTRAAMVSQLASQLPGLIDKRRLWEAEKAIRGEAATLKQNVTGPTTQKNPLNNADKRTQAHSATGRTEAKRGRPRKRSLL